MQAIEPVSRDAKVSTVLQTLKSIASFVRRGSDVAAAGGHFATFSAQAKLAFAFVRRGAPPGLAQAGSRAKARIAARVARSVRLGWKRRREAALEARAQVLQFVR